MSRLADFMQKVAGETYAEPLSEGHSFITAQILPIVCEGLPVDADILDVGCGQGVALRHFRDMGHSPIGIALNPEDVRVCREQGFTVLEMDQNDLRFTDGGFDLVWARHVLEHSIAPYFTLHEFARVLRPGGVLYVEVPAPDTACQHTENRNHYSVLGLEMWKSLIVRSGFDIEAVRNIKLQTGAGPDLYWSFIAKKSEKSS